MNKIIATQKIRIMDSLKTCSLFKGCGEEQISKILAKIDLKLSFYDRAQTLAIEGENCTSIGIIIEGGVDIQKFYSSGKIVTLDTISKGDIFGEVIIFSEMNKYLATIISNDNTAVIYISKNDVIKLCSVNSQFLNNFMSLLSNKILMLNRKIRNLSFQTIRQKVSNFILEESKKQKSSIITLTLSRQEMADNLGVPRPSLSRELISMKKDGIIDFYRNTIKILKQTVLESAISG